MKAVLLSIPVLSAALCGAAPGPAQAADRWRVRYFYDELKSSLVINDFKFLNGKHGVAAGFLLEEKGKIKPTTLTSNDGGASWTFAALPGKDVPLSLFFLGESRGWMVTANDIWRSEDGGRTWRKISPIDDILRVYFVDPDHGWAVAEKKKVYETTDGGKEWKEVPAGGQADSPAESTVYNWIDFAGASTGIITGWNQPVRGSRTGVPEWMNPSQSQASREIPRVSIFLQTRNAGRDWDVSTGSLFGHVSCVRLSPAGFGLGVIEFSNAFEWPSEVFRIDSATGKSERVFREKNRLITDVALPPTGPSYLAGVEKLDRLNESPVPGKLKVLRSDDLDNWQEMDVDYRATAHRAMISAVDDRNIWVATDTGMILKLAGGK